MVWWAKLLDFFRKSRVERDLDDEVRFHLEKQIEQNMAAGMDSEQARYAAQRVFGGVAQVKEECRDHRRGAFLDVLAQDLRFAARTFRKLPGFTAIAVAMVALGVGVNTAVFSAIDAVLLRSMPYREAEGLVSLFEIQRQTRRMAIRPGVFYEWKARNRVFDEMTAQWGGLAYLDLTGAGNPERIRGLRVAANFFEFMGQQAALGRTFLPEEERPQPPPVAILAHGFWIRRFGQDPAVLGRSLTLNGTPHTVIGVLAPGLRMLGWDQVFTFRGEADVWLPLPIHTTTLPNQYNVLARLKPG